MNVDLETKIKHANELREMLDGVREHEVSPSYNVLIPTILQLLRSTPPTYRRDSLEHQFRRVLLEVIHRLPSGEALRSFAGGIMSCALHLMRHDNEELAVASAKIVMEYVRTLKALNEENITEIKVIYQQLLANVQGVMDEYLAEDSPVLDSNTILPSLRSFKLLSELGTLMAVLVSVNRPGMMSILQETGAAAANVIGLDAPAQKEARENFEAMGGVWAGVAPGIKNVGMFSDLLNAQIRVRRLTTTKQLVNGY